MASGPVTMPLLEAAAPVVELVPHDAVDPSRCFVGAGELDELGELRLPTRRVTDVKSGAEALKQFRRGDLLCAPTRSSGIRTWLADRDGYCSGGFSVLRPDGSLEPRYLLWYLRAQRFRRSTLRSSELRRRQVPLPSERREIARTVALLDELASVIALRRRALAVSAQLAAATFQERFGDPLVPRTPWPTATLGEVLLRIETGWSPQCVDRPARPGEWGVIKVSAVSKGTFQPHENKALPRATKPREALGLRAGDLLMVRSNTAALVGATVVVDHDHPQLLLADKVWRLHPSDRVDPLFLKGLLSHPSVRRRLSDLSTGSLISMRNLTQPRVLSLRIVCPPLAAQAEHALDLTQIEQATRAQVVQDARLERLLGLLLDASFPADARAPDPLAHIVVERELFDHLSPLQQAAWKALVQADAPVGMPELSRRLGSYMGAAPQVDALRRALKLLTAVGAATHFQDSHSHTWSEALPDRLTAAVE